jgi:hypothetical protein
MIVATKSFTLELIAKFSTFHFMDVMGICYPQYWLQGNA